MNFSAFLWYIVCCKTKGIQQYLADVINLANVFLQYFMLSVIPHSYFHLTQTRALGIIIIVEIYNATYPNPIKIAANPIAHPIINNGIKHK